MRMIYLKQKEKKLVFHLRSNNIILISLEDVSRLVTKILCFAAQQVSFFSLINFDPGLR